MNLRRNLVLKDAVSPLINKDQYLSWKFFEPNYSKVNLPLVHSMTKVIGLKVKYSSDPMEKYPLLAV